MPLAPALGGAVSRPMPRLIWGLGPATAAHASSETVPDLVKQSASIPMI